MGEALYEKSLLVLRKLLQDGDLTVSEVVQSYLTRVRTVETRVGSFIELAEEEALLQGAKTLDERRSRGEGDISHHPLYGLPVGMKDNIAVRGMRMTNASRMLEHYRSPYDATVTTRLREAEGIIMGKLNMDEFAMGSSTETSALQTTRNPWHTDYVPGDHRVVRRRRLLPEKSPLRLGRIQADPFASLLPIRVLSGLNRLTAAFHGSVWRHLRHRLIRSAF